MSDVDNRDQVLSELRLVDLLKKAFIIGNYAFTAKLIINKVASVVKQISDSNLSRFLLPTNSPVQMAEPPSSVHGDGWASQTGRFVLPGRPDDTRVGRSKWEVKKQLNTFRLIID